MIHRGLEDLVHAHTIALARDEPRRTARIAITPPLADSIASGLITATQAAEIERAAGG